MTYINSAFKGLSSVKFLIIRIQYYGLKKKKTFKPTKDLNQSKKQVYTNSKNNKQKLFSHKKIK